MTDKEIKAINISPLIIEMYTLRCNYLVAADDRKAWTGWYVEGLSIC